MTEVTLGGLCGSVLPLDPRSVGSNRTSTIKICSVTFFGGEALVPRRKIYGLLRKPMVMKKKLCRQNAAAILSQVSPALLLDASAGNC
jgi:hypothetical protein